MKKNLMITTAVLSLFGTVVGAADLGSASYGAGLNLLSPTATGFAYGASVDTTGLGSGAASVAATNADFTMSGSASSSQGLAAEDSVATSGVIALVNFDRTVAASGSSIGLGQVVSQGTASASSGAVGSAYGLTNNNRIATVTTPSAGTLSSTSSASSDSAASLIGTGATNVVAGLLGKDANFVGSTGTTVTSNQTGVAFAGLSSLADAAGTGITITPDSTIGSAAGTPATALLNFQTALGTAGAGTAGFENTFGITGGIDLAVSNVGGGSISLAADTSGFFSGGSAVSGATTFGSVFTP